MTVKITIETDTKVYVGTADSHSISIDGKGFKIYLSGKNLKERTRNE